jgi:hypothetical protein
MMAVMVVVRAVVMFMIVIVMVMVMVMVVAITVVLKYHFTLIHELAILTIVSICGEASRGQRGRVCNGFHGFLGQAGFERTSRKRSNKSLGEDGGGSVRGREVRGI